MQKPTVRTLVSALIVSLNISYSASADVFSYYPGTSLRLGGSFDPLDITNLKAICYVYDEEVPVDGPNNTSVASNVKFNIQKVYGSRDLLKVLRRSSSVSGHYKAFSAGGSDSSSSELDIDEQSESWVITAWSDFGRSRARNLRVRSIYESHSPIDLLEECGSQVVAQVTRGVSISLIITLSEKSTERTEMSSSNFDAAIGGAAWGISAGTESSSKLNELIISGDISINVVATGGLGAPALADIITSLNGVDNISAVKNILAGYIRSSDWRTSSIVEFQTAHISSFFPDISLPDISIYNSIISEYYFAIVENENRLRSLNRTYADIVNYPVEERNNISDYSAKLRSRIFEIGSSARSCRDSLEELIVSINGESEIAREGMAASTIAEVNSNLAATYQRFVLLDQKNSNDALSESISCPFKAEWVDFSDGEKLPDYPFSRPIIFTDSLGEAPLKFLFGEVSGESISSVKFQNVRERSDLAIFRIVNNSFFGEIEYSTLEAFIDLIVTTKSGREYRFPAIR